MSGETRGSSISTVTARQGVKSSAAPIVSLGMLESGAFVALVTAVLYFMGYSYYAGFFERISLPSPFPELSTTDYFLQAFSNLAWLVAATLVSIPYFSRSPQTIWQALWTNSVFVIAPLVLLFHARGGDFLDRNLAVFLGSVVAAGVIASLLRRSLVRLVAYRSGLAGALAYALALFVILGVYFRAEGAADAAKFIEGRLHPSSSVVIQTKTADSPINGARLLVALVRGGGYYVVQQASPAPDTPVVYFVPDSEVVAVTIERVGAGDGST